jgi:hypothetical protein
MASSVTICSDGVKHLRLHSKAEAGVAIMRVLTEFETEHQCTDKDVARWISDELKRRDLPPRRIARPTVTTWRLGQYAPKPLMLEWLRDHAQDERVKTLAGAMIEAMRGNEN